MEYQPFYGTDTMLGKQEVPRKGTMALSLYWYFVHPSIGVNGAASSQY